MYGESNKLKCKAYTSGDESYCDGIVLSDEKEECIGQTTGDVSFCRKEIEAACESESTQNTYFDIAKQNKDISWCEKIRTIEGHDPNLYSVCLASLSMSN